MEEFDFEEKEMSTSINTLRKKKTELDDEKSYNAIRNKLYDEINTQHLPIVQNSSIYVPDNIITQQQIKKHKKQKNKHKKQDSNYQGLVAFSIIFFMVNVYELNVYLQQHKLGYYTIVFIKLILFIILNHIYKTFFK